MSETGQSFKEKLKNNKFLGKLSRIKNIEIIIAIVVCVLAVGIYFLCGLGKSAESNTYTQSSLEKVLSEIKGVGETRIYITYSDSKGYSSYSDDGRMPKEIIGIIVVSEGAGDPECEVRILKAIQTATGVTVDKIKIFEMDG